MARPTGRGGWNAGQTFPAETLTPDEIRQLLGAFSPGSSLGIRNRALVTVMYRGGLRVSEALALRVSDVDLSGGAVRIRRGKGGKARTVGLDPGAVTAIARWLDRRKSLGITGRAPLFCDLSGGAIGAPAVRAVLSRAAAKAGIEKRVHPHGLRHTMAAELDREGVSMRLIQQQLGHSSLAVTGRYLASIGAPEVLAAIAQRPDWSDEA